MKQNNKTKTLSILLVLFCLMQIPSTLLLNWQVDDNLHKNNENGLKVSDFWDLTTPIIIDNNWSATNTTYSWCNGAGTADNPYVIENITINATGYFNGIIIENSNDYFIIRNCTIFESIDKGINVYNADNGNIIDNNCTNNDFGIYTEMADNFNITGNYVADNNYAGIDLESFCDDYNISGSIILNNSQDGIILRQECTNVNITDNFALNNTYSGIQIQGGSYNNNIINNTVNNNDYVGISVITGSYQNNFINNTIYYTIQEGISISESNDNLFRNNTLKNCGIEIEGTIEQLSLNDVDVTNTINGKPIYFYTNTSYLDIANFTYAGSAGQVVLINCSHSYVSNLNLSNCTNGIVLFYSQNNTLLNNQVSNNTNGIYMDSCENNTLDGNTALYNEYGVYLTKSNNNTLSNNNASYNINSGIKLAWYCDNNII